MSHLNDDVETFVANGRLVLQGAVVTMDAAGATFPDAKVCIQDEQIVAIVAGGDLPPEFVALTPVQTGGTIYPGLIELHNHLAYNMLPLWAAPRTYTNRNLWRTTEPTYNYEVAWPAKILAQNADPDYVRSIARYVECRSLFGGTTSTQGISTSSSDGQRKYYEGLVRNVEALLDPAWPAAGGQTLDFAPADIAAKLAPALNVGNPYFYHLSEGTDADARQRFLDLQYQPGVWAIAKTLIAIHCVACGPPDLARLAGAAGMVWSPLSNLLLYGQTADVASAKAAGMAIALGSDWSPSGSKNLLGELKIARICSDHLGGLFTDEELVRMVTSTPARMVQWDRHVGSLEAGKAADLLVLRGAGGDPYRKLVDARESDILLVMIGGRVRLGDAALVAADAAGQELVQIGGRDYRLDLAQSPDPLAGLSLATAKAKLADGLQRIQDLGRDFGQAHSLFRESDAPVWTLDLEMEGQAAPGRFELMTAGAGIDPSKLHPMTLEPMTWVDDPDFAGKLKANPSLPDFVKNAL